MSKKGKNKKEESKNFPTEINEFEQKKQRYEELVNQCLDIIKEYNVLFITDLVAFLPFSRRTFYEYNLHNSHNLKEAIEKQRIFTKQSLRNNWLKVNCATRQIALYKLICTQEERNAISNNPKLEDKSSKQIGENLINVLRQVNECN